VRLIAGLAVVGLAWATIARAEAARPSARAEAQGTAGASASTIDGAQRYTLTAKKTQRRYLVDVLPIDSIVKPVPANYRRPVIYVLDGNSLFPLVSHVAKAIGLFSSQVPGVLVVSIGYPGDAAMSYGENVKTQLAWRTRDLSPPVTAGAQPEGTGGAADFLGFITQELQPFIASLHAVNPEEQTLAGHSMAGLFAVYTMVNDSRAFSQYVAISPSLFWDDHALIKRAAEFVKRPDLASTRLFVAVGEQETKERMGQDMIGDARHFVSVLQAGNAPGLDVQLHVFPDENHMTVVPVALTRGLLQVKALR
jgi:uncharacterized protein